ncbi:pyridine nucleotide-disulfide oxidoreductase domain-containing protein 1 [Lucilia cuprina]|uniref:pyridine nucleotide-disulfide oxidoreductase domain-containing protein 1 n=1 Tax=Lucilia cuprina TaxID=7375 RepID=UPI001F061D9C|nr:pyridine nucleotide-disulfide oxidoreductase domain-containing protein 1 [Lucilia cuprina]
MDQIQEESEFTFVIVGGGIAGVTCAETIAICCPEESILLMTESTVIKTVANLEPVARYLHKFDVQERTLASTSLGGGNKFLAPAIVTVVDQLKAIEAESKFILTKENKKIHYKYLCLCTGGTPRLIEDNNSLILGIRDTDSVLELQKRLRSAKKIVLVGNGGIASELAHELEGVEVHWVVKDNHIASTFIDPGAAYFFQQRIDQQLQNKVNDSPAKGIVKRLRYDEIAPTEDAGYKKGAALGPDWHQHFDLRGTQGSKTKPIIHFKALIDKMERVTTDTNKNSLNIHLTTGEEINCDFIVSATGVVPRQDYICKPELKLSEEDCGIQVNEMMQTSNEFIYAAGDVCTAAWPKTEHWFQMRLWTQARQMGCMAGRSMAAAFNKETVYQDFCFELFGHVTQLFGLPVVLLGRYNGQGLGTNYELLIRSTPGHEYIKFVLQNGKLRGAILIGNTELAETCENLILNGIDLTPFGDDILNPDIDIEDYFD